MDPISIAMGLATIAPQILKWITGSSKVEEVATTVIDIAKEVTGHADPLESLTALKANPELALRYREALLARETELDKAYLADKADARNREVELARAGRVDYRMDFLAFLAVAGLVICVYLVAKDATLPERAVNAIMFVAGVFAAAVRDVFSYFFGSSRGSAEKTVVIESLLKR